MNLQQLFLLEVVSCVSFAFIMLHYGRRIPGPKRRRHVQDVIQWYVKYMVGVMMLTWAVRPLLALHMLMLVSTIVILLVASYKVWKGYEERPIIEPFGRKSTY